jgi:hypothetical protein
MAGNPAAAAKEKSLAAAARKKHFAQGNHKRAEPEPAIRHEAAAVQLQNHGNLAGAAAERAKENKSELKQQSGMADKASGKSTSKGSSSKSKSHH